MTFHTVSVDASMSMTCSIVLIFFLFSWGGGSTTNEPQGPGLIGEVLAEVGVCDVDQRGRPFVDTAGEEVGDAVLGGDNVHVASAGHHAGSLGEGRDDAADRSP